MYTTLLKPSFDFIGAFILIILFSPLFIITALLIRLKIGGAIFFTQERPGYHEKIFKIYKFRTMSNERDEKDNLLPDEKRLHSIGKSIRSLSLDELPQLLNILKGEMSFIGPRPLLVEYLPLYNDEQKKRHDVKPGITGWAQINGRNAISWQEKFNLDSYYTEHISLFLDIKIFFLTILKVMKRDNISSEDQVTTTAFKGNNNE